MPPFNGGNTEFIAKNLRILINRVFVVLSVIELKSDDFISFLVIERIKNRQRHHNNYIEKLYR